LSTAYDRFNFGLGATRRLSTRLSGTASYSHIRRTGDSGVKYQQNRISLGLRYQF
jgi:hypothetical protein